MSETAPVDIGKVIAAYIATRDRRDEVAKRHKEELAIFTSRMTALEKWLQAQLATQGLQSLKAGNGIAFLKPVTNTSVENWGETLEHVKAKGAYELLTQGVSKTEVLAYIERHGEPPPGVKYSKNFIVQVRRA